MQSFGHLGDRSFGAMVYGSFAHLCENARAKNATLPAILSFEVSVMHNRCTFA